MKAPPPDMMLRWQGSDDRKKDVVVRKLALDIESPIQGLKSAKPVKKAVISKSKRSSTLTSMDPNHNASYSVAILAARLPSILEWLTGADRSRENLDLLLDGLCRRLIEAGLPAAYMRLITRTLNPLVAAWGPLWTRDPDARTWQGGFDIFDRSNLIGSPAARLLEGYCDAGCRRRRSRSAT
jgi:hypothetical protein